MTPALLRAGILRDGCLLVRGLVDRDAALQLAEQIDRAFAERDRHDASGAAAEGYYEEFAPEPRYPPIDVRGWIKAGGGVLAADSPMLTFEMLELFDRADVPTLVEGYLGEPAVISVHKTTLRKAEPTVRGAWHQDGNFMGEVRALNLWLSLSRCGDEAPGPRDRAAAPRDLVPTKTEEAFLDIQVSQSKAEEAAGDKGIVRPIFEPGDALFFDELFLHQTGLGSLDAEAPVRDRELVLRRVGVPGRLRAARRLDVARIRGRRGRSAPPALEPQDSPEHPLAPFFAAARRGRRDHYAAPGRKRPTSRALITMVHNEAVFLPIWLRYYSRFFAPGDIYVLDNDSTDGSTDRDGFVRIPVVHDSVDHVWMVRTIEELQHELQERYDVVLVTDVDEIVAPVPEWGTLGAYLDRFDEESVNCLGYEILHMPGEAALDVDRPILDQRGHWFSNGAYNKAAGRDRAHDLGARLPRPLGPLVQPGPRPAPDPPPPG